MKVLALFALVFAVEATKVYRFLPGHEKFSADVYKELKKSNSGNFLVSPISVEMALILVRAGAKGRTAGQITKGIRLGEEEDDEGKEMDLIPSDASAYNLTTVNKIYVGQNFEIADTFKKFADIFEAEVENIDFSKSSQAANKINKWVEKKTNKKITKVVNKRNLNSQLALILVNTLHFEGKWKQPFQTTFSPEPFFVNEKLVIPHSTLKKTGTFEYHESSKLNAKILRLPYQGDLVRMTIVLPNDVEGLSTLENKIKDVLLRANKPMKSEKVSITIPKFAYNTSIEFKPLLQALGIVDAFEDSADFSGMVVSQKGAVKLGKVFQKTAIDVNEIGTTVAAATVVDALATSEQNPKKPKIFNADHPFLYYLSTHYGTVLFVGRFTQP